MAQLTRPVEPFGEANGYRQPDGALEVGYLARFAGDGRAHVIYWACSPDGFTIEPVGTCTADGDGTLVVRGPKQWGRQTKLLPPVRYFIDKAGREAAARGAVPGRGEAEGKRPGLRRPPQGAEERLSVGPVRLAPAARYRELDLWEHAEVQAPPQSAPLVCHG
jgi:hypothetical protein